MGLRDRRAKKMPGEEANGDYGADGGCQSSEQYTNQSSEYSQNGIYNDMHESSEFVGMKEEEETEEPLPEGWIKQWDESHNRWFYVDTRSSPPRSTWTRPSNRNANSQSIQYLNPDQQSYQMQHSTLSRPQVPPPYPQDSMQQQQQQQPSSQEGGGGMGKMGMMGMGAMAGMALMGMGGGGLGGGMMGGMMGGRGRGGMMGRGGGMMGRGGGMMGRGGGMMGRGGGMSGGGMMGRRGGMMGGGGGGGMMGRGGGMMGGGGMGGGGSMF